MNQRLGSGGDRPPTTERPARPSRRDTAGWNIEAARRRDRLTPEERAERRSTCSPQGGVGYGFDSDQTAPADVTRFWDSLTDTQRRAARDPAATIVITALASRVGDQAYNLDLAQRRGDNLAAGLRHAGARAAIIVDALGDTPAADRGVPRGRDDRTDRVAYIDIIPSPGDRTARPERPRPDTELTEQAIRAMESSNSPLKERSLRVLRLFRQPDADDRVLQHNAYMYDNDRPGARVQDPGTEGYVLHSRNQMMHALRRAANAPDMVREVERQIRILHAVGYAPVRLGDAGYGLGGMRSMSEAARRAKDWVAHQQRNPKSIYSCWTD